MRVFRAACLAFSFGLAGFVGAGAVFCQATLHVPRRLGPAPPDSFELTLTTADHAELKAWWMPAARANGNCVVVLHGIGDSHVGSAGFGPMFLSEGYGVLLPDSRAHGISGGDLVTYGILEKYDVIAWVTRMRALGCGKVYGLGESLSASVLIEAAALQPVFAAVVAECPYSDLRSIARYRVQSMAGVPGPIAGLVVFSALIYAHAVDGIDFRYASRFGRWLVWRRRYC